MSFIKTYVEPADSDIPRPKPLSVRIIKKGETESTKINFDSSNECEMAYPIDIRLRGANLREPLNRR